MHVCYTERTNEWNDNPIYSPVIRTWCECFNTMFFYPVIEHWMVAKLSHNVIFIFFLSIRIAVI